MNIIVYSKEESFEVGARRLKNESLQCGKICKIVEIEDFVNLIYREYFETERTIYFLSSDYRIPTLIELVRQRNQTIINETFLARDILTSKFESLERSRLAGVCVPKHTLLTADSYDIISKFTIPVFIKSKNPRGQVIFIDDKKSFNDKLKLLPERCNYYLEESVQHKNNVELKFYYVDGVAYTQRNIDINIPDWFFSVLDKISKCTELDVFSVDCFVDWGERMYYCFDINHASSFYKSDDARTAFITKILK